MKILQATCLRPTYTLRRQLFAAFGSTSTIAIAAVMLIGTLSAKSSGENVKAKARESLTVQVTDNLASSSRFVAETISKKFGNLGSAVSLMVEVTRDRFVESSIYLGENSWTNRNAALPLRIRPSPNENFAQPHFSSPCDYSFGQGYPDDPGYADDSNVPFRDVMSGKNKYPLKGPSLPLDWQIETNIDVENQGEHLQGRFEWYEEDFPKLSTAAASYRMQGQCNPNATDPNAKAYYPNCSDANNNVTTGGTVQPTSTNALIYEKASDLDFVLKPLFESHEDVKLLGIFFANSGAGSSITFPSIENDGTQSYTSIGCDWMKETNPLSQLPYATEEEISRCHVKGTVVTGREYNALERAWCRDQALSPFRTNSTGPYLDAWNDNLWLLTFGRAVFDRTTKALIGCTLIDVSIQQVVDIIHEVKVGETSKVALIRWNDEGTVVASSLWDPDSSAETARITDLSLGLGIDSDLYQEMRSLVNFDAYWTPEQVRQQYRDKIYHHDGKMVSMFPIPVPPQAYDEIYHPEFMVIMSIEEFEVYGAVDEMEEIIDENVRRLVRNTLIIGFSGLALVWLVLWADSRLLTRPLLWMQNVSGQIINNAGGRLGKGIDLEGDPLPRCSPKTEINTLVTEFRKMVCGFSGEGAAKVVRSDVSEIENTFTWKEEFRELYTKSEEGANPRGQNRESGTKDAVGAESLLQIESALEDPIDEEAGCDTSEVHEKSFPKTVDGVPPRLNLGKNVPVLNLASTESGDVDKVHIPQCDKAGVCSSPLFWWVMVSVVAPQLVTMVVICTIVMLDIKRSIPTWLEDVQSASVQLERDAIVTASELRASFAQEVMAQPIRDLHLYSRVAGWLLFGGINRSNSFSTMTTGVEECKDEPANGSCDYIVRERNLCEDGFDRNQQQRFYNGQSQDIDSITGDRQSTSYPDLAYSPDSTEWWDSFREMPGSDKNWTASGHKTTYDRARVLSAMSVIEIPLFNYYPDNEKHLGSYIGLEADGLFMGYTGCDFSHAQEAHWVSSIENGAADIRPELCPLGKYGFDCRCRDWYAMGRKQLTGSPIHITPPYVFSTSDLIASSATFALVDTVTQEHVGQTLLDFLPGDLLRALLPENTAIGQGANGFAIVITPYADNLGGDTVVAPGFELRGASTPIGAKVLPFDEEASANRKYFDQYITADMKAGHVNTSRFKRSTSSGGEEWIYMAFAPVTVKALRPVFHGNFASGVDTTETLIYSLGIAIPESDLTLPFSKIKDEVYNEIQVSTAVLTALIVVASVLAAVVTYAVTVSVTRPIIALLRIVVRINSREIEDDFPEIDGGSQEVSEVSLSFEKLYKVVRFSLSAFFSGDLSKAREILREALDLFDQLGNKKAMGIANNNLGNVLTGIHREEAERHPTSPTVRMDAKEHYDEAIKLGEEDVEKWSGTDITEYERAVFVKQLANRYFNRGVFLLTARSVPSLIEEWEQLGCKDLKEAKRLDEEARRLWAGREKSADSEAIQFDDIVERARGLIDVFRAERQLQSLEVSVWSVVELIKKAEAELALVWDDPNCPLFANLGRFGRRQQLEGLWIDYASCMGRTEEAARIGMRMLVEDEYIVMEAAKSALVSLLLYACASGEEGSSHAFSEETVIDIKKQLSQQGIAWWQIEGAKNVYFCLDYSASMRGGRIARANQNMRNIYENYCSDGDYVGFVRFDRKVDCELTFPLERKADNVHRHRSIMAAAINTRRGTKFYTALEYIVDAITNSRQNEMRNSWIVALTDGESFDKHHRVKAKIESLNATNFTTINVIIVGFEVTRDVARVCADMCSVSDHSLYIDARGGLEQMDKAFERVAKIISGGGLTMESF